MLSMTAEALLQALQQAWYSVGCATSHEVHSEKCSNIVPLTEAVSDQSEDLNTTSILSELKGVLQKKNILFKQCPANSHHRMGAVERVCGLVKIALKRSQLKDKSLMLQDWLYVVKRIEYMINSRILNVKYVDQDFKVLTPYTNWMRKHLR